MLKRSVIVASVVAAALATACTTEIGVGDPTLELASLALRADSLGALQAEACVKLRGAQSCPAYPNPQACDTVGVSVRGDGSTVGTCTIQGATPRTLRGFGDGLPFACRMEWETGCVQCEDIYGGAVVDTCADDQRHLFTGKGFLPEGAGFLDSPQPGEPGSSNGSGTPNPSTGPQGSGASQCQQNATKLFIEKINALLAKEGFKFSWTPDLTKLAQGSGFFGANAYFADMICSGNAPGVEDITSCDLGAKLAGRCYCEQNPITGVRCRCSRITASVLSQACAAILTGCDPKQWAVAIWSIYSAASQWLLGANLLGYGVPALGGPKSIDKVLSPENITCIGSPLLLDLAGDGVALGPAASGVRFDLFGSGTVQTAWVAGSDDAFLALDRNGDGRITGGAELFGEGSPRVGGLAADGFEALAELDRPRQGGNGNGLLEPGDLMFDELVLWTDRDRDGRSQPGELRSLADAGVTLLEVQGFHKGRIIDSFGNDLSLRARFERQGGSSGLLVDALLTYTAVSGK